MATVLFTGFLGNDINVATRTWADGSTHSVANFSVAVNTKYIKKSERTQKTSEENVCH
jgi:hypothetical protein